MKKIIYLYLTVFLITSNNYAQSLSGKIAYKVTLPESFSLLKKMKSGKVSEGVKNYTILIEKGVMANIKFVEHQLIFNNDEALYKSIPSLNSEESLGLKSAKLLTGSSNSYYFNLVNDLILRQVEAYGQLFLIKSSIKERKWTLSQDTKIIGSYLCYKATSIKEIKTSQSIIKKAVIVWYAPKLPVPYGPKGYGGLPGLILQLTEGDFTFYVSKLTLNPKREIKIKIPTKGKKVTQAAFEKIGEESRFNFVKMRN